jgi:hypothetical protein
LKFRPFGGYHFPALNSPEAASFRQKKPPPRGSSFLGTPLSFKTSGLEGVIGKKQPPFPRRKQGAGHYFSGNKKTGAGIKKARHPRRSARYEKGCSFFYYGDMNEKKLKTQD